MTNPPNTIARWIDHRYLNAPLLTNGRNKFDRHVMVHHWRPVVDTSGIHQLDIYAFGWPMVGVVDVAVSLRGRGANLPRWAGVAQMQEDRITVDGTLLTLDDALLLGLDSARRDWQADWPGREEWLTFGAVVGSHESDPDRSAGRPMAAPAIRGIDPDELVHASRNLIRVHAPGSSISDTWVGYLYVASLCSHGRLLANRLQSLADAVASGRTSSSASLDAAQQVQQRVLAYSVDLTPSNLIGQQAAIDFLQRCHTAVLLTETEREFTARVGENVDRFVTAQYATAAVRGQRALHAVGLAISVASLTFSSLALLAFRGKTSQDYSLLGAGLGVSALAVASAMIWARRKP